MTIRYADPGARRSAGNSSGADYPKVIRDESTRTTAIAAAAAGMKRGEVALGEAKAVECGRRSGRAFREQGTIPR